MTTKEELKGSCLCGSVSYTLTGQTEKFYHCHCKRCRKATGSAHASNIIMAVVEGFTWNSGANQVGRHKVEGAIRFETVFCTQCGSLLPRVPDDLSYALVPAGSLDHEPSIQPQGRIFMGSKAAWSCSDKQINEYDQYPK